MKTQKEKKDSIIKFIDYLTENQINLIFDLTNLPQFPNKKDLLKLAGYNMDNNFDTAYPCEYFAKIKDTYPDLINGNYIFDYSDANKFGALVNINNLLANRILKAKYK